MHKTVTLFLVVILLTSGLTSTLFPFHSAYGSTIPVGDAPTYVAIDEITNTLYVVNQASNDVTVIDGNTNQIIETIPVGPSPTGAEVVQSLNRLYVLNQDSFNISVIDTTTNTIVDTIKLTTVPFGQEFNPLTNLLYVGNPLTNTVTVIDVTTNNVITTIPVGITPVAIQVNTITNRLYVSNLSSSNISIIDGATNTVIGTIPIVGGVGLVGIDENTNTIYVPTFFSNKIFVIDGSTNSILDDITVGQGARRAIFDASSNRVYAISFQSETLSIIDATTNSVVATLPVDSPFGMNFNSVTKIIYIVNNELDTLTVVELLGNSPPTANAGPNQLVNENNLVSLDGTGSSDPDNDDLGFNWIQISGQPITFSDPHSATPTFVAPHVDGKEVLSFKLTVNDGIFDSPADIVEIIVVDNTNFQINLSQTGSGTLVGGVDIGDVKAGLPIGFDFVTPKGTLDLGQLDKTVIIPGVDGTGVSVNFEIRSGTPPNIPNLPVDPGLFFDIDFLGIDFSNPSSFSDNRFPTSQFTVPLAVDADNRFSDGCPIVPIFLFNEVTNQWEKLGNPEEPNTNKVFVADIVGNSVSVVDIATNQIIETIPVGPNPRATLFNPNTNQLYVSNFGSNTITVIDSTTNSVITTITNGASPFGMAIDTNTNLIYVVNSAGNISVINGLTNTVSDTITLPGVSLITIALDFHNQKGFVTDLFTKTIYVIDLTTNKLVDTIAVHDGPATIAINPSSDTAYASMFLTNLVDVIDTKTNDVIKTLEVGNGPSGTVFNPNNNKVYVTNTLSNIVSVIDTETNTVIKDISVGNSPFRIALIQDTNRIYVSNTGSRSISIIDGNTDVVIGTIENVGFAPFAISANPNISNPVRDPSTDKIIGGNIAECSYLAGLPHLSKFAIGGIRALALGALPRGGGGSHGSPSSFGKSSFGIISGGEQGFGGILNQNSVNTFDQTKTFKVGDKAELRFDFTAGGGIGKIEHIGLFTNIRDGQKKYDSDTYINYDPLKSPQVTVHDPNGLFSEANFELLQKDAANFVLKYDFTFAKPMQKSDFILESWNTQKQLSTNKIPNAIEVTSSGILSEKESVPVKTFLEDVTDDQVIPVWIKSNAKWWSDGTIDNDNFISGIEYLVNEGIIKVSLPEGTDNSISEMPSWIKNTAGWWADDMISEDEFVTAIEWLISHNIIQVAA